MSTSPVTRLLQHLDTNELACLEALANERINRVGNRSRMGAVINTEDLATLTLLDEMTAALKWRDAIRSEMATRRMAALHDGKEGT